MEKTINPDESYKSTIDHDSLGKPPLIFLRRITNSLRILGTIILLATSLNVIFLLLVISKSQLFNEGMFYIDLLITFINFVCIVFYENLRKRGEAIFEEISDELHWFIGYREKEPNNISQKRPEFQIRVLLRSFAKTTDLPLIPGKFGPAIYMVINIAIISIIGYFAVNMKII